MVGTSGSASDRVVVVTPSARSLPALMYSIDEVIATNITCTCPPAGCAILSVGAWDARGNETARIHHAFRRRCRDVAARRARSAGRDADDRVLGWWLAR